MCSVTERWSGLREPWLPMTIKSAGSSRATWSRASSRGPRVSRASWSTAVGIPASSPLSRRSAASSAWLDSGWVSDHIQETVR